MKVWTVSCQKGGVGKTTTVVTLGGLLASRGYKTLLVDLDPHGSLTSYFRMDPDTIEQSGYDLFRATINKSKLTIRSTIVDTGFENLSVIPAATAMATLDRQASGLDGMGLVVSSALSQISEEYDFVLLDTPPMLGVLLVNALAACERLLIPVQTEFLALKGLERMMRTVQMINRSRANPLPYTIVPTMYDQRTRASIESLNALQNRYSKNLWKGVVPVDTKVREASRLGSPASVCMPNSRAVLAYGQLLESLLHRRKRSVQKMAM
jgi:chromosome partitioning protein